MNRHFASCLFDNHKKKTFSSFSNCAKKVSGHKVVCVTFLEYACNIEKNETKCNIEFAFLIMVGYPAMQILNLLSLRPCVTYHYDVNEVSLFLTKFQLTKCIFF